MTEGRCLSTISNFVNGARSEAELQKKPNSAPPGRSTRTTSRASAWAAFLSRKSKMSQHSTPSTVPSAFGNRLSRAVGQRVAGAGARVPVDVGREILDVQLAAQLLAEERDVGADDGPAVDEDRRVSCRSAPMNFGSALDGTMASRRGRRRRGDTSPA